MEIHFAPMQGYADAAYRRLHALIYGGVDCYYTPFIRIEKGVPRRQDMARLRESLTRPAPLVPQVIFNSAAEFLTLTAAIKALGCKRIDLNLGCPYPMQTGRGRGAAMIARLDVISEVAAIIADDTSTLYSVKMRLGLDSPDQWRDLIPILNNLKLSHVAVHPRVARQMYTGELHRDRMAALIARSANPVIWNGDILAPADIHAVMAQHPSLKGVMIGRGMLARPSLAAEWREGTIWPHDKVVKTLLDFHHRLLDHYEATLCGDTQILQKIKPFWDYLEPTIGHRLHKTLRKSSTLPRYRAALLTLDM